MDLTEMTCKDCKTSLIVDEWEGQKFCWCDTCQKYFYWKNDKQEEFIKQEFLDEITEQTKKLFEEKYTKLVPLFDGVKDSLKEYLRITAARQMVLNKKNIEEQEERAQIINQSFDVVLNMLHSLQVENGKAEKAQEEGIERIKKLVKANSNAFSAQMDTQFFAQSEKMESIGQQGKEYFIRLNEAIHKQTEALNEYDAALRALMQTSNEKIYVLNDKLDGLSEEHKEQTNELKKISKLVEGHKKFIDHKFDEQTKIMYERYMTAYELEQEEAVDCPFCGSIGGFTKKGCSHCGLKDSKYHELKQNEKAGNLTEEETTRLAKKLAEAQNKVLTLDSPTILPTSEIPSTIRKENIQLIRLVNVRQLGDNHKALSSKPFFAQFNNLKTIIIQPPSQLSYVNVHKNVFEKKHAVKFIGETMEGIKLQDIFTQEAENE